MIDRYASQQGSRRLRRLAFRINRASRLRDAESIHDLRAGIRRFQQCLRVFHQRWCSDDLARFARDLSSR